MGQTVSGETQGRGRKDARRRGLTAFLVIAALLHLPLTPLGALFGLLALLRMRPAEAPAESLSAIPVSLLSDDELARLGLGAAPPAPPPEPAAPAEPEAPEAPPPPKPKPTPKPKPKPRPSAPDGGAPDAAPPDAGPREKPVASATPPAPATPDGGAAPAVASKSDPFGPVGRATSITDPNANVKLLLMNDRIRPLPIAPRIGKLVARLPQWKSFFGPTGIDPIQDIDRIFVTGPQFRVSSEVVAVLQYGIPEKTMHQAVDQLVNREPKGEWYDTKIPSARARADRAERVFVLPKGRILLMVPPHLRDDAVAKAGTLKLPPIGGSAAVAAFVSTPWRALMGIHAPIEVPRSIRSVSLLVTPTPDGGAILSIDATDESDEAAKDHASLLTRAINTVTQQHLGGVGSFLFGSETLRLIEPVDLRAQGDHVTGDAVVTAKQLSRIIGFAEGWVDAIGGAPLGGPRPPVPGAPAPAPAPTPPPVPSPP